MGTAEIIGAVATAILTPLGSWWLLRTVKKQPRLQDGARVLVFSGAIRFVAVVAMIMALGLYDYTVNSPRIDGQPNNPGRNFILWLVFPFLPALAAFLLFFLYRISFNAREIEIRTPWLSRRRILWEDVTDCEKGSFDIDTWYRFKTRHDGTFKVRVLMHGVEAFLEEYSRQTGNPVPLYTHAEAKAMARRSSKL